jgi:hypothetical protein
MIESSNPFNDPEVKKQLLRNEGIEEPEVIEETDYIKDMLASAPQLPKSAKNIILDSSTLLKQDRDAKSKEFNLALNSIISSYNEKYGTSISLDLDSISTSLVEIADPDKRKVLELYVSEVFKSIKPLLLLHVLNRLVICLNYVTDPKRFLDIGNSGLTLPDLFLVLEKLMGYINSIDEITKSISIDSSDAILQKLADEKNDSSINSPESREAVENFMKLFKKDAGIED